VKVAQYEVLGNDAKRDVRPASPERLSGLGTIETFGSWSRGDFSSTSNHLSSPRDGRRLKWATQHFVLGYFHRVPAGLIFYNSDLCDRDRDLLC
jgi:hypothetical protein